MRIIVKSIGGGGVNTVDISKNITNECEPSKIGPSFREGCYGLNIRSTCKIEIVMLIMIQFMSKLDM